MTFSFIHVIVTRRVLDKTPQSRARLTRFIIKHTVPMCCVDQAPSQKQHSVKIRKAAVCSRIPFTACNRLFERNASSRAAAEWEKELKHLFGQQFSGFVQSFSCWRSEWCSFPLQRFDTSFAPAVFPESSSYCSSPPELRLVAESAASFL